MVGTQTGKTAVKKAVRGKNAGKNIRPPVGVEATANKLSQADKIRMATGKQLRLDASFYERLPEYSEMQLFWENDEDGAVERWLHLGAALVPRKSKSLKHFKGFTDRAESEWECVPVGTTNTGNTLLCYLLFLPKDEYHALRIAPKEQRNQEVMAALGQGKAPEDAKVMGSVTGIQTYAPNLPTGGKGLEITHDA